MWTWITLWTSYLLWLFCCLQTTGGIDSVRLVLPPIIRAGTTATLLCLFDLEGAPLYTVKWYRGRFEFYRYLENDQPHIKVFNFPGIYVDVFSSNEHQVTLRNIPAAISGEITCEITTEAPSFTTSSVSANLSVVELDVELAVRRRHFHVGDTLQAVCKAVTTAKDARLAFHLNSRLVPDEFITRKIPNTARLDLNLTSSYLHPGDELLLRCSAWVDDLYHVTSRALSLHLDPGGREESGRSLSPRRSSSFFMLLACFYYYRFVHCWWLFFFQINSLC